MSFVEMSFSATVLILIIMLLRKFLLDRLPKRAFLILWGIALLRLLVPVSVPSSFSIYSLIQRWDDGRENMTGSSRTISSEWNTELLSGTAAVQNHSGMQMAKIQETESGQMERSGHKSFAVSPKILLRCCWAFGMSVLAVFFLISYTGCCRKFRRSFPVKNEFMEKWLASHMLLRPIAIRTSEAADTPLTYGILHPVILMPEETDWKDEGELYQVLEHEFVHIKRMDSLAKLIMTAAVCVHWFNPAVWRMYLLYNRDLELSCDEAVLRKIGKERRGDYARTLIRMEERRAVPAPLFSAFGRNASNQMEERITSIMKTRKHSVITMVLTAFLVGAALLVFATSARAGTVPSPESGAESKPAADPAKGEAETQSAAKPGEADWMKEFTDEETQMLLALWIEDYENMTVSQFREKSQTMTDTKEYMALIERFSGLREKVSVQVQAGAALSAQGFADYFYHVYEPLNADRWQTREFGDYVMRDFSGKGYESDPKVALEYFLSMTILNPDEVTAGEYRDARREVRKDLAYFWQEMTAQELSDESFMEDAIGGKIKEITNQRGSENLKLSIRYFFNSTDLRNAGTENAANTGDAGNSQEPYYGDKKEPRQWPMGTRGDYDSLLALMTQDGSPCGEMPLADFNRSLLDWANEDYERMERIGEDTVMSDYQVSLDEDERRFVELTMRLSAGENAQLVRSHYKGTQPEDPWWGGRSLYKTAFDGAAFCTLYYQFPYHIPDDGRITVSERDERMEKMEQGILELFQSLEFEELLTLEKEDMVKRLEALAEELSDEKLAIAIDEDQIGFEHTGQEEYDILMNDRDTSGITVDAAFLSYDGTNNMYLQEMITNRTQKTICRVEYCMLAYEEDGSPLKIRWNFMDSSAPESYEYVIWNGGEILPGDTRSFPGGWSVYDSVSTYGLEPPEEEYTVGYVLIGIRQVEFEDGSTWMDPEYEGWLAEHKGKKMDPENLKNYYPIEREIP